MARKRLLGTVVSAATAPLREKISGHSFGGHKYALYLGLLGLVLGATPAIGAPAADKPLPEGILAVPAESRLSLKLSLEKSAYRPKEEVRIRLEVKERAFVYLFGIDARGNVTLLFPNAYSPDNRLPGGKPYVLPEPGRGYRFVIEGPPGTEYLQAVATLEPLPPLHEGFSGKRPFRAMGNRPAATKADLEALLGSLPEGTWTAAWAEYRVLKPGEAPPPPTSEREPKSEAAPPKRFPLYIDSDPAGVPVYLDGDYRGDTPLTVWVSPGHHELRLPGPLCRLGWTGSVEVLRETRLEIPLKRIRDCRGTVRVRSTPSGADVYVDGSFRGRTPLSLTLAGGVRHRLKIAKEGYEPWSAEVLLDHGDERLLSPELLPRPATLTLLSEPPGAEVYVNGDYRGATPLVLDVRLGDRVTVSKPGYRAWTWTAAFEPGPHVEIEREVRLPAEPRLTVTSEPPGARVYLDGMRVGETPLTTTVSEGVHRVEVRACGYLPPQAKRVTAAVDRVSSVSFALEAIDRLEIASEPSGAAVYVNGQARGTTPMTIPYALGDRVELRLEGYYPQRLRLDCPRQSDVFARLEPKPALLKITSDPPGAVVYVDGRERGRTEAEGAVELRLAPGFPARLELSACGYRPWSRRITAAEAEPDRRIEIHARPEPLRSVEVESEPPGATVLLDGEPRGTTPTRVSLPAWDPGGPPPQLSLALEGYRPWTAGCLRPEIAVTLSPLPPPPGPVERLLEKLPPLPSPGELFAGEALPPGASLSFGWAPFSLGAAIWVGPLGAGGSLNFTGGIVPAYVPVPRPARPWDFEDVYNDGPERELLLVLRIPVTSRVSLVGGLGSAWQARVHLRRPPPSGLNPQNQAIVIRPEGYREIRQTRTWQLGVSARLPGGGRLEMGYHSRRGLVVGVGWTF